MSAPVACSPNDPRMGPVSWFRLSKERRNRRLGSPMDGERGGRGVVAVLNRIGVAPDYVGAAEVERVEQQRPGGLASGISIIIIVTILYTK